MELGLVAKWLLFVFTLAAVGVLGGALSIYLIKKRFLDSLSLYMKNKRFSEESDASYKLEPSNASDLVAVSDQPKKRERPVGSTSTKLRP